MINRESIHCAKRKIQKSLKKSAYNFNHHFLLNLDAKRDIVSISRFIPDKIYIKMLYKHRIGKDIDLGNPVLFNEKLNWIKLYDRNPKYTMMVDKYAVRQYVADTIGEEYLVPLIGAWDSADEIDFSTLPEKYVLKPNNCSSVFIYRDGKFVNKKNEPVESSDEVRKLLDREMKHNYYQYSREWQYKNIKRKIICEKYMENSDGVSPLEYEVFCFNGKPRIIRILSNRFNDSKMVLTHYDTEWNHLDMTVNDNPNDDIFEKPSFFDMMIDFSKKLSKDTKLVRVDFNFWDGKLYFGELTFFDSGGFSKFLPEHWNYDMCQWINLK